MTARRPRSLAALAYLAVVASGCSGGSDEPEIPQSVLDGLTSALGQHTLAGVDLADAGAAEVFTRQVDQLADVPVSVTAGAESVSEQKATVPLSWTWQVEDHTWAYSTQVGFAKKGDTWQVDWKSDALAPQLSADEDLDLSRTLSKRADILGAGNQVLVTERDVLRYGLDKQSLSGHNPGKAARAIARSVDIDVPRYVAAVKAAGPKAFVEAITVRTTDRDTMPANFSDLPGARILEDTLALAPSADFAAPILGKVGPATAEIVEKSEGRVRSGDVVGLSGLQARYDEQLAGSATIAVLATPTEEAPADAETRELKVWQGKAPRPVKVTLDAELQAAAERALGTLEPRRGASALVAIKPSTGEILAAGNGAGTGGANVATFGRYAPGSTFKVVSSLAMVRAGLKPNQTLPCPATTVVNGKRFKNYDDYPTSGLGAITFADALANSCNTAFVQARTKLGADDLGQAAADLGLGVDHDLGFPAYFGQVPVAEGETEKAADMIGQGKVLASPMAMAAVAASVQSGRTVVPHLLNDPAFVSKATGALKPAEAQELRTLMQGVVQRGSGRFLAPLGDGIGAKTGTAEFGTPGENGKLLTHTWMIAFSGDLAVAVMVEKGDSGSGTAGPVLADFLKAAG